MAGIRLTKDERYYERGLDFYHKNNPEAALADMDEAIAAAPRKAEYYAARGLMLLQSGAVDEAEADFAQALKLDPRQWLAHYGRGMHAYHERRYDEAVTHFSRAQRLAPRRPEVYLHRAAALRARGEREEARQDVDYALELLGEESDLPPKVRRSLQNKARAWQAAL